MVNEIFCYFERMLKLCWPRYYFPETFSTKYMTNVPKSRNFIISAPKKNTADPSCCVNRSCFIHRRPDKSRSIHRRQYKSACFLDTPLLKMFVMQPYLSIGMTFIFWDNVCNETPLGATWRLLFDTKYIFAYISAVACARILHTYRQLCFFYTICFSVNCSTSTLWFPMGSWFVCYIIVSDPWQTVFQFANHFILW